MLLVLSLFLSFSCMSAGLFATTTALSDRMAIGVRLLKANTTTCAALPFEIRPYGKSMEA